jgi:hypothetical protein
MITEHYEFRVEVRIIVMSPNHCGLRIVNGRGLSDSIEISEAFGRTCKEVLLFFRLSRSGIKHLAKTQNHSVKSTGDPRYSANVSMRIAFIINLTSIWGWMTLVKIQWGVGEAATIFAPEAYIRHFALLSVLSDVSARLISGHLMLSDHGVFPWVSPSIEQDASRRYF